MAKKGQIWETRPLEFWGKAKELRAGWQQSIESRDTVVGQGNILAIADWSRAFPAIGLVEDNPAGSMIASQSSPYARKCRLASEVRGWGREICGYQNTCWGAQFLGYQLDGTPFPYRKFVVPIPCLCDQHNKRGQQVRDYEPVPQWMMDQCVYLGDRDEHREEAMLEHRAFSMLKQINDIERIFGQPFDDEKFHDLLTAYSLVDKYSRDISVLMADTKPTPLSIKDYYSVYTIGSLTKIDPEETVKFWKLVRDEVEWRAQNQIAAVGNERFRWIEAHPPSWHFLKYYRYMENYGAVCLGSQYAHRVTAGCLERKADGSIDRREMLYYPQDTPLVTREDGVRVCLTPDVRYPHHHKMDEYIRHDALIEFADIFQADGALLAGWRCGVGCTFTRKEQAMRLRRAGINVMFYEGSQPGDRTDLDEKRFLEQLDTWMETQGLEKLDD